MFFFTIFIIFLFGLCLGSFLAAFSYRFPRNISIVRGRSLCPKCGRKISWWDNLPLVSFVLLKARCRNCRKKISWRYFYIELLGGLILVSLFLYWHFNLAHDSLFWLWWNFSASPFYHFTILLIGLVVLFLLLLIFIIDFEHKIIPDQLVFTGLVLGLVGFIFSDSPWFFANLLTGLGFSGFLLLIYLLSKGKGMGLGDVKLAFFLAFILGWPLSLIWFSFSALTGAIVGSILILARRMNFGREIPFGPFLIVGFVLVVLFGNYLSRWLIL